MTASPTGCPAASTSWPLDGSGVAVHMAPPAVPNSVTSSAPPTSHRGRSRPGAESTRRSYATVRFPNQLWNASDAEDAVEHVAAACPVSREHLDDPPFLHKRCPVGHA